MKNINKWILSAALILLGALDLAKDITGDLVASMGWPASVALWVKVVGFFLTAYVAQQSKPIKKRQSSTPKE